MRRCTGIIENFIVSDIGPSSARAQWAFNSNYSIPEKPPIVKLKITREEDGSSWTYSEVTVRGTRALLNGLKPSGSYSISAEARPADSSTTKSLASFCQFSHSFETLPDFRPASHHSYSQFFIILFVLCIWGLIVWHFYKTLKRINWHGMVNVFSPNEEKNQEQVEAAGELINTFQRHISKGSARSSFSSLFLPHHHQPSSLDYTHTSPGYLVEYMTDRDMDQHYRSHPKIAGFSTSRRKQSGAAGGGGGIMMMDRSSCHNPNLIQMPRRDRFLHVYSNVMGHSLDAQQSMIRKTKPTPSMAHLARNTPQFTISSESQEQPQSWNCSFSRDQPAPPATGVSRTTAAVRNRYNLCGGPPIGFHSMLHMKKSTDSNDSAKLYPRSVCGSSYWVQQKGQSQRTSPAAVSVGALNRKLSPGCGSGGSQMFGSGARGPPNPIPPRIYASRSRCLHAVTPSNPASPEPQQPTAVVSGQPDFLIGITENDNEVDSPPLNGYHQAGVSPQSTTIQHPRSTGNLNSIPSSTTTTIDRRNQPKSLHLSTTEDPERMAVEPNHHNQSEPYRTISPGSEIAAATTRRISPLAQPPTFLKTTVVGGHCKPQTTAVSPSTLNLPQSVLHTVELTTSDPKTRNYQVAAVGQNSGNVEPKTKQNIPPVQFTLSTLSISNGGQPEEAEKKGEAQALWKPVGRSSESSPPPSPPASPTATTALLGCRWDAPTDDGKDNGAVEAHQHLITVTTTGERGLSLMGSTGTGTGTGTAEQTTVGASATYSTTTTTTSTTSPSRIPTVGSSSTIIQGGTSNATNSSSSSGSSGGSGIPPKTSSHPPVGGISFDSVSGAHQYKPLMQASISSSIGSNSAKEGSTTSTRNVSAEMLPSPPSSPGNFSFYSKEQQQSGERGTTGHHRKRQGSNGSCLSLSESVNSSESAAAGKPTSKKGGVAVNLSSTAVNNGSPTKTSAVPTGGTKTTLAAPPSSTYGGLTVDHAIRFGGSSGQQSSGSNLDTGEATAGPQSSAAISGRRFSFRGVGIAANSANRLFKMVKQKSVEESDDPPEMPV